MKDSVVFYKSFRDAIKELPKEDQLKVYDAIFDYAFDGSELDGAGVASAVFKLIKPQIDANEKRWRNGQKGGRPSQKNNQDETKPKPKNNQDETKPEPNVNDNVNENVNVNDNTPLTPQRETEVVVSGYFNDPELDKSFSDYVDYRQKMNSPVDFQRTQKKLYDMAKGDKKTMIAILEQSLSQGYKGLYELKQPRAKPMNKAHFENERNYDFDEIERTLVGGAR